MDLGTEGQQGARIARFLCSAYNMDLLVVRRANRGGSEIYTCWMVIRPKERRLCVHAQVHACMHSCVCMYALYVTYMKCCMHVFECLYLHVYACMYVV